MKKMPFLFVSLLLACGEREKDTAEVGEVQEENDGTADDTQNSESDSDGDGVPDETDAFPEDSTESVDSDGDGVRDKARRKA